VNKIILALDTPSLEEAINITKRVKDKIFTVKLGLEFFNANGKEGIRKFKPNLTVKILSLTLLVILIASSKLGVSKARIILFT
jgi:orotidine-5'-phosphate decarboxylase